MTPVPNLTYYRPSTNRPVIRPFLYLQADGMTFSSLISIFSAFYEHEIQFRAIFFSPMLPLSPSLFFLQLICFRIIGSEMFEYKIITPIITTMVPRIPKTRSATIARSQRWSPWSSRMSLVTLMDMPIRISS